MVKWRIERGVVQQTESLVRGFYEVNTVSGSGVLYSDTQFILLYFMQYFHFSFSVFTVAVFPVCFKSTKSSLSKREKMKLNTLLKEIIEIK